MFRRLLYLLTLAALVNLGYQYWPRSGGELIKVMDTYGKFGYIDLAGRIRTEPTWDSIREFDEQGMARVKKINSFGYVDRAGKIVVPAQYEVLGTFDEQDMAPAEKAGKAGFINRKGEVVIPLEWDSVTAFSPTGYATVTRDELAGRINRKGEVVLPPTWTALSAPIYDGRFSLITEGELRGLIDAEGKVLVEPRWYHVFARDMRGVLIVEDKDDGWSVFDLNTMSGAKISGNVRRMFPFSTNGLARVWLRESGESRIGWINRAGEWAIAPEWRSGSSFDQRGLASAYRDGGWGSINSKGEFVLEPKWKRYYDFDDRDVASVFADEKWGLMDRQGSIILPPTWNDIGEFDQNGYATMLGDNEKWGYLKESGEVIIEPKWDELGNFDTQGYVWGMLIDDAAKVVTQQTLIDNKGNEITSMDGAYAPLGEVTPSGHYVVRKNRQQGKVRELWNGMVDWVTGEQRQQKDLYLCQCWDLQGNLIWSSNWMRKTNKAWLWILVLLVAMLVAMRLDRRQKEEE